MTEDQIFLAAGLTAANNDVAQLEPMIAEAKHHLETADAGEPIGTVVADAGYLSDDNIHLELGCELLIAPAKRRALDETIEKRDESLDDRLEEAAGRRQRWKNELAAERRSLNASRWSRPASRVVW